MLALRAVESFDEVEHPIVSETGLKQHGYAKVIPTCRTSGKKSYQFRILGGICRVLRAYDGEIVGRLGNHLWHDITARSPTP